jgi:hypothetical protein
MKPNPGYLPAEAQGKRVRVLLRRDVETKPFSFEAPADGRGACSWAIKRTDFDIARYEVL